jgi:mono/diheme cytochrome c family protein
MTDRDPSNNPKDVQEEAKELKPNRESGGERDNPLEREFESTDERDLEPLERQHDPLTDPEDNAKVNRVVARPVVTVTRAPEARPYLVSPGVLRNLFIASSVAGVLLVVAILTLASSRDQARYTPADETQYERTLQEATESISATGTNEDGQTARIPIDEAMALVAAQGLEAVNTALAAPPAEGAPAQEGAGEPQAAGGAGDAGAGGQAAYEANCASCHQVTGQGAPGAFPPLTGHVPALYNADRSYLINLLLYGLQGEIQVQGQPYNGQMPAWQQLSDDDIAGILNYVSTAWGNEGALQDFQPYQADEVASTRDAALSADEVYALRQELALSGDE